METRQPARYIRFSDFLAEWQKISGLNSYKHPLPRAEPLARPPLPAPRQPQQHAENHPRQRNGIKHRHHPPQRRAILPPERRDTARIDTIGKFGVRDKIQAKNC